MRFAPGGVQVSDFPTSNSGARRAPRSTLGGFIIALVVVVIWSVVTVVGRLGTPATSAGVDPVAMIAQDIGYAVGSGLFIAGVVSLILFFTHVKQRAPERGTKHFLILWGTASAVAVAPIFLGMAVLAANPAGESAAIMADHEARSEAVLDRLDMYRRLAEARARLVPEAVAAPGGLERARQAAADLKTLDTGVQQELKAVMDDTEARLLALRLTDRQRAAMRRELAVEQGKAQHMRALTQRAADLQVHQIEVLARQPRGWRLHEGSIAFTRAQDLQDFNVLTEELSALATEVVALRAASEPPQTKRP